MKSNDKKSNKAMDIQFGTYNAEKDKNKNIKQPEEKKGYKEKIVKNSRQGHIIESIPIAKPKPKGSTVIVTQAIPDSYTGSWSSLLNQPIKEDVMTKEITNDKNSTSKLEIKKKIPKNLLPCGNILESGVIDFDANQRVNIHPRGLINIHNSCYMNATLQALLYIPSFYGLFKKIHSMKLDGTTYPLTYYISKFVSEFQVCKIGGKLVIGNSCSPSFLIDFLSSNKSLQMKQGRQQDSQEFLGWLLEALTLELNQTKSSFEMDVGGEKIHDLQHEDGWEQIGKQNRVSSVQEYRKTDTSITRMFEGKMKSTVKRRGQKPSITLEPFLCIHLPLTGHHQHILDSFDCLKLEEILDSSTKKQLEVEVLPEVLILHLKRFSAYQGVLEKSESQVKFPLSLDASEFSNTKYVYDLTSIICHHGSDPSVGHYSTFAKAGPDNWVHFNDQKVTFVSNSDVLRQEAYILFYTMKRF